MRETTFIRQKKKSWKKFEDMQRRENANPDELTKLFVEITDDLSYTRTFYNKRSVRVYLNYLSQLVFLKVNKNKKVKGASFVKFFTSGLPMEFARSWKPMLLSLIVFFGALMVGVVSTANDIGYATEIMGSSYIEMTDENIKNGDPMAVYHQHGNSAWSSFGLTQHNTRIAAFTYTSGIIAGIPPIIIMIKNGIMLGTFHYYLFHKGVLSDAMWIIWIHGVLEISAIIIAGGAGLLLGGGLLFPGTYTRLQSLRISAKRSFKIALSCVFILIISGFLEGSITRYTNMPMALKYCIVLGSLAFICFYFIAYPIYLYKTKIKTGKFDFKDTIPHVEHKKIAFEKVREVGDIFNDTLNLFRQSFGNILSGLFLSGFPLMLFITGYHFFFLMEYDQELYWWVSIENVFRSNSSAWINLLFLVALISPLFLSAYYAYFLYRKDQKFKIFGFYKFCFFGGIKLWPLLVYLTLLHLWPNPLMIAIGVFLVPFIFQFSYLGFYNEDKYSSLYSTGIKLVFKSWFGSIGVFLLQMVIPLILVIAGLIISKVLGVKPTSILDFITEFFLEHVTPFTDNVTQYANALNFMLYYLFFAVIISFVITGLAIQFHSIRERIMALTLYERLQDFGTRNNLFEQADEGDF